MKQMSAHARLQDTIQFLKEEQDYKRQLLIEQLALSYESLKPLNLITRALTEITTSPDLTKNVIGTLLGLASGFLSRKILVGTSANIFRKLLGSVLQFGVTNIVAQHPDSVKSIGRFVLDQIIHIKETKSQNRAR
jgi:hypothetical protein